MAQQQSQSPQSVGNTTTDSLAKVLTNEIGSLSTPKGGDPKQIQDGVDAVANTLINNANNGGRNSTAPDTGTASPDLANAMQDAVTNRENGGPDPAGERTYFGTSHTGPERLTSRPIGHGRQTVYKSFGPFKDSTSKKQTYIYIYNDPGR